MSEQKTDFSPRSSSIEKSNREKFIDVFNNSPVPDSDLVYSQLSLYLSRQEFSRMIFLSDLYRSAIIPTNGTMFEFGTCYGRTAAILTNLRAIFEPYNFTRKLVIFDTFGGLLGTSEKDGHDPLAVDGLYSSGTGYEHHLEQVLSYHESEAPISHLQKFEIIKGDASLKLEEYLKRQPETIVSLAYFDFDIYKPTKDCLRLLRPHLTRNSVLVFDQLNCPGYPGETIAVAEEIGLDKVEIKRSPLTPWISYMTCDFR